MKRDKIIIALDVDTLRKEDRLLALLAPYVQIFKIGMELFYSCGIKAIELVRRYDRDIFLDLKFHDIPNTVRNASRIATSMGIFMFNLHISGGIDMMRASVEGSEEEARRLGVSRPKIIGVTVLTSIDESILKSIGIETSPREEVLKLARLAKSAGLDGVVASPEEAGYIREKLGKDFLIVTPGVRPEGEDMQDQRRVATPAEAFLKGADYIVIGRPVIDSKDPVRAIKTILEGIF